MTSHAQPISTPPGPLASPKRMRKRDSIGVDKRKRDGEGDSVSVANMGMIGTSCFTGPGWGPPSVFRSDQ